MLISTFITRGNGHTTPMLSICMEDTQRRRTYELSWVITPVYSAKIQPTVRRYKSCMTPAWRSRKPFNGIPEDGTTSVRISNPTYIYCGVLEANINVWSKLLPQLEQFDTNGTKSSVNVSTQAPMFTLKGNSLRLMDYPERSIFIRSF
jgi:hypothetical protein